jgi:hypothetical protein
VEHRGEVIVAECYFMQPGNEPSLPNQSYFDMVVQGYEQHGVPTDQVFNSVYDSITFPASLAGLDQYLESSHSDGCFVPRKST